MSALSLGTKKTFVITVSSRALFDLEESHKVFEERGIDAFEEYQKAHQDEPLKPGPAMELVRKLLKINEQLPEDVTPFEVILLSRNSPETALRVFDTIEKLKLPITRYIFTNGSPTSNYIDALETRLFLSSNPEQVTKAIQAGIAAATVIAPKDNAIRGKPSDQIRIAFDGDAVLWSDESERAHAEGGLEAFHRFEAEREHLPLGDGPLKPFLEAIHHVQQALPREDCPIRTALVTARGAPAHKRALLTLQQWGVRVDECMFLGGRPKGKILKAFGADLFFDDSLNNVEHALEHVSSAHVPFGVRNLEGADDTKFSGGQAHAETPVAPSSGSKPAEHQPAGAARRPRP